MASTSSLPRIAGIHGETLTSETLSTTVPGNGYAQHLASFIQKQFSAHKNGSPKNKKIKGLVDESCSKRIESTVMISIPEKNFHVEDKTTIQQRTKDVQNMNDPDRDQRERDSLQRLVALSSGVTFDSNFDENESNSNSPHHSPIISPSSSDGGNPPPVSLSSIFASYLGEKKKAIPGLTENLLRSFPSSSTKGQVNGTHSGKEKYRRGHDKPRGELFVSGRMNGGSHEEGGNIPIRQSRISSTAPNSPNNSNSPMSTSAMSTEPSTTFSSPSPSSRLNLSHISSNNPNQTPFTPSSPLLSTCTRSSQKEYLGVGKSLLSIDPDSTEDALSQQVINSTPRRPSQQPSPPSPPPQHPHQQQQQQQQHSPYRHSNQGTILRQPPSLLQSPSFSQKAPSLSLSIRAAGMHSFRTASGLDVDELDRKQTNRDVEGRMGRRLLSSTENDTAGSTAGSNGGSAAGSTGGGNGGSNGGIERNGRDKGRPVDVSKPPTLGVESRLAKALDSVPVVDNTLLGRTQNGQHHPVDRVSQNGLNHPVERVCQDPLVDGSSRVILSGGIIVDKREERVRQDLARERKKRQAHFSDEIKHEDLDYFSGSIKNSSNNSSRGGGGDGDGDDRSVGMVQSSSHSSLTTNPENSGVNGSNISQFNSAGLLRNGMMLMMMMQESSEQHGLKGLPRNNGSICLPSHLIDGSLPGVPLIPIDYEPALSSRTCSNHNQLLNSALIDTTTSKVDEDVVSVVDLGMNTPNSMLSRGGSTHLGRQMTVDSLVSPLLRSGFDSSSHHNPSPVFSSHSDGLVGGGRGGHLPTRPSSDSLASDLSIHSCRQAQASQQKSQVAAGLYDNIHPTNNSMLLMMTGPIAKTDVKASDFIMFQPTAVQPLAVQPSTGQLLASQLLAGQPLSSQAVAGHPLADQSLAVKSSYSPLSSGPPSSVPSRVVSPTVPTTLAKSFQSPRSKRSTFIEAV